VNIWSPKKRDEKLDYTHNNPVKPGPVKHPGRLAVVELEVLFLERRFGLGRRQNAVTATYRGSHTSRQKPSGRMRHPRAMANGRT
jgi:hypothetical protein